MSGSITCDSSWCGAQERGIFIQDMRSLDISFLFFFFFSFLSLTFRNVKPANR